MLRTCGQKWSRYIGDDLVGKCIEASEKIAERISSALRIKAVTVEGWCQFDDEHSGSDRPWDPHTWVEVPSLKLYIDVTADQFNCGMYKENDFPAVIVREGLPHGMCYDEPTWNEYEEEDCIDGNLIDNLLSCAVTRSAGTVNNVIDKGESIKEPEI